MNRLARKADVFLESFRPGVAARLGVGYEAISALNPRVIYVSISGFGQTGPESTRPAMDPILQAFTGLIATNRGPDGIPHRVQPILMDMSTALCTFQVMATTLHARRDEPRGRYLDVSLIQAGAAMQFVHMTAHHLEGGQHEGGAFPGRATGRRPTAGCTRAFCTTATSASSATRSICRQLKDDARYATSDLRYQHAATLTPVLEAAFAAKTTAELGERLKAAGHHARAREQLQRVPARTARRGDGNRHLDRSAWRGSGSVPAGAGLEAAAGRLAARGVAVDRPAPQGDTGGDRTWRLAVWPSRRTNRALVEGSGRQTAMSEIMPP